MDKLIVAMCPDQNHTIPEEWIEDLPSNEANALRYAAGYIVRKVKEKVNKSHPSKQSLLFGLELMEAEDCCGHESGEWISTIDRGGLTHIMQQRYL